MKYKFIAISDLHGNLPVIEDDFDILIIAGDICPVYNHSRPFQKTYLLEDLSSWTKSLNFRDENSRVVLTAGNHDFAPMSFKQTDLDEWKNNSNGRIVPLLNDTYNFNGITIAGTPWCKPFGHWAWLKEMSDLRAAYDELLKDGPIDILFSHDAPKLGEYGMVHEGWQAGAQVGNPVLAEFIADSKPRIALHGHIHTSSHDVNKIGETFYRCVSLLNEDYNLVYEPFVFEMDNETKEITF